MTFRLPRFSLIVAVACAPLLTSLTPSLAEGATPPPAAHVRERAVCETLGDPTAARCDAHVVTTADGVTPAVTPGPHGLTPDDVRAAYGLGDGLPPLLSGSDTPTVAIVDAYDSADVEGDLATYRSTFGLPACSTASGCLTIAHSGAPPEVRVSGWATEIALDLDAVSAACPACRILLVEATTNAWSDLLAAVDYARKQPGVVAISNSYAGGEFRQELSATYNGPYNRARLQGIAVTASTGDSGYAVNFPAVSPDVVAVGGTTLNLNSDGSYSSETVWSQTGGGCSGLVARPSYQPSTNACRYRMVADVAAVADPASGLAVFGPDGSGQSSWLTVGGTSLSSPIIASVFALSGRALGSNQPPAAAKLYATGARAALHDVISGSNGRCKGSSLLCVAGPGYDGPTGVGTPKGTAAF